MLTIVCVAYRISRGTSEKVLYSFVVTILWRTDVEICHKTYWCKRPKNNKLLKHAAIYQYLRCIQEKFVQVVVCPGTQSKSNIKRKLQGDTTDDSKLWNRKFAYSDSIVCTFHRKRFLKCNRSSVSCNSSFRVLAYNAHRTSLLSSLQRSPAITANHRLFGVHWWKISVNRSAFRPLKTRYIFNHTQQNRVPSNKASHNSTLYISPPPWR